MIASTITAAVMVLSIFTPLADGKWTTTYEEHGPYLSMQECKEQLNLKFKSGIQGVGSCKWKVFTRQK